MNSGIISQAKKNKYSGKSGEIYLFMMQVSTFQKEIKDTDWGIWLAAYWRLRKASGMIDKVWTLNKWRNRRSLGIPF